jgi:hypothetical protein
VARIETMTIPYEPSKHEVSDNRAYEMAQEELAGENNLLWFLTLVPYRGSTIVHAYEDYTEFRKCLEAVSAELGENQRPKFELILPSQSRELRITKPKSSVSVRAGSSLLPYYPSEDVSEYVESRVVYFPSAARISAAADKLRE